MRCGRRRDEFLPPGGAIFNYSCKGLKVITPSAHAAKIYNLSSSQIRGSSMRAIVTLHRYLKLRKIAENLEFWPSKTDKFGLISRRELV
jgi:hypothetical protein